MGGFPSVSLNHRVGVRQNNADNATVSQGSSQFRVANAAGAGGVNAFFALPDDILITVLQSWLENEAGNWLKALSALDIACCSSKHRQLLVSLFAAVTIPHYMSTDEHLTHEHKGPGLFLDHPVYFKWLASRRVQVEQLVLYHEGGIPRGQYDWGLTSPSIKYLTAFFVDMSVFTSAFQCCANVQSIHIESSVDQQQRSSVWSVLAQPHLNFNSLQYLRVSDNYALASDNFPHRVDMAKALQKMPNLTVLAGCRNTTLTADLVNTLCQCSRLEMVMAKTMDSVQAIRLLTECKQLHTLTLETFADPSTIGDLLAAGRGHLKRFVIVTATNSMETFLQIMEQHSWLDELRIDRNSLCRSTKALTLRGDQMSVSQLERIAVSMPTIAILSISWREVHENLLHVHQLLCGTVEHLTVSGRQNPIVHNAIALASACPLLKHLTYIGRLDDIGLMHLVALCKGLQTFSLSQVAWFGEDNTTMGISDMGMKALLGCPDLVKISLDGNFNLTYRTLHAIATRCYPFKSLTVTGRAGYLGKEEIADFGELAKERQLLPVPVIEVPCNRARY